MKHIALVPIDLSGCNDQLLSYTGNSLNSLQSFFVSNGYQMHTVDRYSHLEDIDVLFVMDITRHFLEYKQKIQEIKKKKRMYSILLTCECPVIQPKNWDINEHMFFDMVLTWNDDLIDNQKYFHYTWIQNGYEDFIKKRSIDTWYEEKDKFLTLINGNKQASRPHELYSQRRNAIRFFTEHTPDKFDLYGVGWDKPFYVNVRSVRHVMQTFGYPHVIVDYIRSWKTPSSYRGEIEDKFSVLRKYKFAICYENMHHINGYITEKIWDCFRVRTVPIYWGADNITSYIPSECFIDRRMFSSHQEVLDFLLHMSEKRYKTYLQSIDSFVRSEKAKIWFDQYWAKQTGDTILQEIKKTPYDTQKR